jgi:hypothetical protein
MKYIDHLEFIEPSPLCDIKVGTFHYFDANGEEIKADFYIRTCEEAYEAKRVDDLNQQFTDEWTNLIQRGCTKIEYKEITPSPIF